MVVIALQSVAQFRAQAIEARASVLAVLLGYDNQPDPRPWVRGMNLIMFLWGNGDKLGRTPCSQGKWMGFVQREKLESGWLHGPALADPTIVGIAVASASHYTSGRLSRGWQGHRADPRKVRNFSFSEMRQMLNSQSIG